MKKHKCLLLLSSAVTIGLLVLVNIFLGKPIEEKNIEIHGKKYSSIVEIITNAEKLTPQTKLVILDALKDQKIDNDEYKKIMDAFKKRL